MNWSLFDFLLAGGLLASVAGALVVGIKISASPFYRAGFALALLSGLALVWAALAVGIVGKEGSAADLMYAAILMGGLIGALVSRFRPAGMTRTLYGIAAAMLVAAGVAFALTRGAIAPAVLGFHVLLAGAFALSGYLCGRAGGGAPGLAAGAGPR